MPQCWEVMFHWSNDTILTLETAPINTSAVWAECCSWKKISEQNIQMVISTSQDVFWYVAVDLYSLQLDSLLFGVGVHIVV